MLNSLFRQNMALLVGVVLVGQLLAALLITSVIVRPQTERVAHVTAQVIDAFYFAAEDMTPERREAFLQVLNQGSGARIIATTTQPQDGSRAPKLLERLFMRALADEISSQPDLEWQTDSTGRLWIKVKPSESPLWLSVETPDLVGPITALLITIAVACATALVGGLIIQRRLAQPLQTLAASVGEFDPTSGYARLSETGPDEIKAVARAFNGMASRLSAIESDRAFMLAGVSHDLRTPLARLRLALDMVNTDDRDLILSADRQAVRMDAMLTQFSDFARGFEAEDISDVSVAEMLGEAVDSAELGDAISVECPPDLTFPLRRNAMIRAVANLLSNAHRHGRAPIALSAAVQNGALRVTVRDAGDGIQQDNTDQMLRPFVRGQSARGGDGTGLGLAIAQRVARTHGGGIDLATDANGFSVTLTARTGAAADED